MPGEHLEGATPKEEKGEGDEKDNIIGQILKATSPHSGTEYQYPEIPEDANDAAEILELAEPKVDEMLQEMSDDAHAEGSSSYQVDDFHKAERKWKNYRGQLMEKAGIKDANQQID